MFFNSATHTPILDFINNRAYLSHKALIHVNLNIFCQVSCKSADNNYNFLLLDVVTNNSEFVSGVGMYHAVAKAQHWPCSLK